VDLLLAPTPQWPPESGIPGGHAQGFKGAGIRIAVPGTGCNPEHPEFAGRSMPAGTLDVATYGTGVCSVIGGSYIGIAPESIIEPITVMTSQLQTTDSELAITLTRLLTNPPDIVCLTLAFDGLHPESPLRQAIAELVKHDVLVVAAAGNDGEGGLTTPGVLPEVLSVGYCDFSGAAADNSSHGWWTEVSPARAVPDVFGYGVDVNHASDNDGYEAGSGSTYGAAYVAGVAALYAQALGLRGEPLKELLIRTADPQTKVIRFAIETDRASAA
jgi:subtilisin family serine protease